eukprot:935917-Pleurochrysis_carterae.AAC.1
MQRQGTAISLARRLKRIFQAARVARGAAGSRIGAKGGARRGRARTRRCDARATLQPPRPTSAGRLVHK